jgi:hypothetical protein
LKLVTTTLVVLSVASIGQARDPLDRITTSTDVAWLEQVAEVGRDPQGAKTVYQQKDLRSKAYVRLGAIGSAEALAAVRRLESAARQWPVVPVGSSLGRETHPSAHFGDGDRQPFVQTTSGGRTYALIESRRLGGVDAFLVMSDQPSNLGSWSHPRLVPNRTTYGILNPVLSLVSPDKLQLEFDYPSAGSNEGVLQPDMPVPPPDKPPGRQVWTMNLSDMLRDRDGDGWSDLEERRLGTDATKADSDGDGVPDGLDACPRHKASPLEAGDQEAAILAKVFFAGFGVHQSDRLLIVGGGSRPLQLWGSRGPVLYGVDRSEWAFRWGAAPLQIGWRLTSITKDTAGIETAVVTFSDYAGSLAAAGYTATLRRLDNEWFVVSIVMNWIS